jgi:hypothetical protein
MLSWHRLRKLGNGYISNSYVNLILSYEWRNFICHCTIITLIVGSFESSTTGKYDIIFLISSSSVSQTNRYTVSFTVVYTVPSLIMMNNTLHRNNMVQIVIFSTRLCYELYTLFITPRWNYMWTKLKCETLSQITTQVRRRISCVKLSAVSRFAFTIVRETNNM